MKTTLFTTLASVALCGGAFAQGSDSCGSAQPISGDGSFSYDNTSATTDGATSPLCYKFGTSQVENDVWFAWTAANSGPATVSFCAAGSIAGHDTKIAIYDGDNCATSNIVDCNDDTCGLASQVTHPNVVAGSTYLIRIGSFSAAGSGTGTFCVNACGTGGGPTGSDDCSTADVISGCGTFEYNNTGAGTDGLTDAACYKFGTSQVENDVWFSWTAPNTGSFTAGFCNGGVAGHDTKMAVYADTGACPPSPALDCNDDTCGLSSQISWSATAGNDYLIRIGSFSAAATGAGTWTIDGCSAAGPGTNYCIATPNSSGNAASISGTGSASISANDLTLIASDVPQVPGIGMFIAGPSSGQVSFFDGFLCVGQVGLQRINVITPPVGGTVTEAIDYTGATTGGIALNVVAGSSYFYQHWFRDPAAMATNANFSDGYEIVHTP